MVRMQVFIDEKCIGALTDIIDEVAKGPVSFRLEKFNKDSHIKKENLYAKKILVKYGTNQVPFILFINSKDEEYAALYKEHKSFTVEKITELVKKGYEAELPKG